MTDSFRELDRRSNDRIDVRLLWRQRDDRVIVTVADGKTGKRFTVDVTEGESALDVFHPPSIADGGDISATGDATVTATAVRRVSDEDRRR